MNIDERLEALTQSVELLASFHKDNDARMAAHEARMAKLEALTERIVSVSERLSAIALDRAGRLDKLEGKSE